MIGALTSLSESNALTVPAADVVQTPRPGRVSAVLGWLTLGVILVAGVPLFLCMPFWFDVYHYDGCARTIMRGGVMYRDVFDNNLPGVIWLHAALRTLLGWRPEMLHLADLIFYTVDVLLLVRWVPCRARVWLAAAFYAFYLFIPEPCPCQRDIWMLLPCLIGLTLRQQQVGRLSLPFASASSAVTWGVMEGLCWGAAVWIKPFAFAPAFACWLIGLMLVRRTAAPRSGRALIADAAGLLLGGLTAGALGLAWMWHSGCWTACWEILLNWNRDYAAFSHRPDLLFDCWLTFLIPYLPWSLAPLAALYFAPVTIRRELRGQVEAARRPSSALLAAFFLGWFVQAAFLQLPHDYAVAPATLPALALLAAVLRPPARSDAAGKLFWLGAATAAAVLWCLAFRVERVHLWARCCREGATPEIQSLLATRTDSPYGVDAFHLARVADYLRGQKVGDGELTCMSGCTHPLYLDLDVKPSTRFPQVEMTTLFFVHHRDEVLSELNASRQRFIVSDLTWTGLTAEEAEETNPDDPLALPREFPDEIRSVVSVERAYCVSFWQIPRPPRDGAGLALLAAQPRLRGGRPKRLHGGVLSGSEFPRRRDGPAKRRRDRRIV